ncbi:hypothetical protein AX774_g7410 [Zancudomyces culisetae]|uniref:Uncharacterized protein n=1 Tax=Zancudomyces culisetae TaxID=1213189 RepID=A0A1R1PE83_ZANCU|nr:hypothetical protein AX774_g7410 [Zancudomyces culisetae]|eukprot:OMH79182.1 hypothetical protein AX774_g7410 [Zancudomyces culisetae]
MGPTADTLPIDTKSPVDDFLSNSGREDEVLLINTRRGRRQKKCRARRICYFVVGMIVGIILYMVVKHVLHCGHSKHNNVMNRLMRGIVGDSQPGKTNNDGKISKVGYFNIENQAPQQLQGTQSPQNQKEPNNYGIDYIPGYDYDFRGIYLGANKEGKNEDEDEYEDYNSPSYYDNDSNEMKMKNENLQEMRMKNGHKSECPECSAKEKDVPLEVYVYDFINEVENDDAGDDDDYNEHNEDEDEDEDDDEGLENIQDILDAYTQSNEELKNEDRIDYYDYENPILGSDKYNNVDADEYYDNDDIEENDNEDDNDGYDVPNEYGTNEEYDVDEDYAAEEEGDDEDYDDDDEDDYVYNGKFANNIEENEAEQKAQENYKSYEGHRKGKNNKYVSVGGYLGGAVRSIFEGITNPFVMPKAESSTPAYYTSEDIRLIQKKVDEERGQNEHNTCGKTIPGETRSYIFDIGKYRKLKLASTGRQFTKVRVERSEVEAAWVKIETRYSSKKLLNSVLVSEIETSDGQIEYKVSAPHKIHKHGCIYSEIVLYLPKGADSFPEFVVSFNHGHFYIDPKVGESIQFERFYLGFFSGDLDVPFMKTKVAHVDSIMGNISGTYEIEEDSRFETIRGSVKTHVARAKDSHIKVLAKTVVGDIHVMICGEYDGRFYVKSMFSHTNVTENGNGHISFDKKEHNYKMGTRHSKESSDSSTSVAVLKSIKGSCTLDFY